VLRSCADTRPKHAIGASTPHGNVPYAICSNIESNAKRRSSSRRHSAPSAFDQHSLGTIALPSSARCCGTAPGTGSTSAYIW